MEMSGVSLLVESCQSKHSLASMSWLWFLSCLLDFHFIPVSGADAAVTRLVGLPYTHTQTHARTHTRLTAVFRDYPGEPVPER